MRYQWDEVDAPLQVVQPVGEDVRVWLMERAWAVIVDGEGVVAAAREHYERQRVNADWSRRFLEGIDRRDARDVRSHLVRFIRQQRPPEHGSLALIGGEGVTKEVALDLVLLEHFGRVSRVPSGTRFVARAIHDQPDIVVVHDDLAELDPVAAALLIRTCAPRSMLLLVTEAAAVIEAAARAGVDTCSSSIIASDLEQLLERIAA